MSSHTSSGTTGPDVDDAGHRSAEPSDPDSRHPALVRLREEQRSALTVFKQQGFGSRRNLLLWLHTFQYRTLGRVADWVFALLPTKDVTVACCLNDPEARARYHPECSLDADERESERRRQVSKHLRPACRKALRELRTQAIEYVDVENEPPDPAQAESTALRPALAEYKQRQRTRLRSWLQGFDDVDALAAWVHEFDFDTLGELENVPGATEFDYEIVEKRTARRVALGDELRYMREREHFAARYLLPATNRSVRDLVARAGETSDDGSGDVHVPQG